MRRCDGDLSPNLSLVLDMWNSLCVSAAVESRGNCRCAVGCWFVFKWVVWSHLDACSWCCWRPMLPLDLDATPGRASAGRRLGDRKRELHCKSELNCQNAVQNARARLGLHGTLLFTYWDNILKILQVNVALIGVEISHRKEDVSEDTERDWDIHRQISVCSEFLLQNLIQGAAEIDATLDRSAELLQGREGCRNRLMAFFYCSRGTPTVGKKTTLHFNPFNVKLNSCNFFIMVSIFM